MLSSLKPSSGRRWPRGQRFSLSRVGVEAVAAFRQSVAAARTVGREALEAAQRAWAAPRLVAPGDGVVLCEIEPGSRSLGDLARALEPCGLYGAEVRAAVDRLVEAGLVDPVPTAAQLRP